MTDFADLNITVPKNIVEAAREVQNYMMQMGVDDWELMGICSRSMHLRFKESALKLTTMASIDHISRNTLGGAL